MKKSQFIVTLAILLGLLVPVSLYATSSSVADDDEISFTNQTSHFNPGIEIVRDGPFIVAEPLDITQYEDHTSEEAQAIFLMFDSSHHSLLILNAIHAGQEVKKYKEYCDVNDKQGISGLATATRHRFKELFSACIESSVDSPAPRTVPQWVREEGFDPARTFAYPLVVKAPTTTIRTGPVKGAITELGLELFASQGGTFINVIVTWSDKQGEAVYTCRTHSET